MMIVRQERKYHECLELLKPMEREDKHSQLLSQLSCDGRAGSGA